MVVSQNNFDNIYQEYKPRFVRFAKTYVYDIDIAEDIVMDSFIYYWENRKNIEQTNIPAYILVSVKTRCLNYLKRKENRSKIEKYISEKDSWELDIKIATLEACNPEQLFHDEVQELISKTLASIPKQSREIFIKSKYENLSNKDIATHFGLSVKSIEYHITKTLKVLRTNLKDYLPFIFMFLS